MPLPSLSLLQRLRRHRGLWLLVMAVLLIKLVSSSVCVADGGQRDGFSARAGVVATMTLQAAAPAAAGDTDCLLGEGGSCHCACAHAAGLPTSVVLAVVPADAPTLVFSAEAGRVPAITASLLRPPIA